MTPSWAQDRPNMGPRWPQDGPRWPQDGPKMGPRWPKMAPRAKDGHNPYDNILFASPSCHFCNTSHAKSPFLINLSEHGNGKRAKSGESHRVSVGGRNPKMVQDSPGRMPRWPNMEQDNRCWSDETHLGNTRENATRHCLLRRLARRRMIFGTCQGAKVCSRSMKSLWRVRSVRANVLRIQIVILRQDASSKATKGSLSESESHHSKSSNMKTSRWYKWKKHY